MADEPKKMGRPVKTIDFEQLDRLCNIQCTLEEIASFFDVSADTIERRIKEEYGITFAEHYAKKAKIGRISLRRKQYQVAVDGNTTMLIFLGKQYLNQSDKQEIQQQVTGNQTITVNQDNILDLIKKTAKDK